MKTLFSTLLVLLLMLSAQPALAESVVRSGETVSIAADQIVNGDLYSVASVVNISGTITEDLVAAGGKVTLNGVVEHDLLMLTGSADLHGLVNQDARIIAGEVIIAEPIAGDVLVLSGRVEILSTASIGGDLLLFGGEALVEGSVAGKIIGYASELRIDAPVGGDITISTEQLTIGDRADIAGTVRYTSSNVAVRSQNAAIAGELLRNDPVVSSAGFQLENSVLPILTVLFTALLWYLLSRRTQRVVVDHAVSHLPRSLLVGLAVLLTIPLFALLLLISMIGLHAGVILLLLYLLAVLLGVVVSVGVLGRLLFVAIGKGQRPLDLLILLSGTIGMWGLVLVPVLGTLLVFGLLLIGLGAVVDVSFKKLRH